MIEEKKEGGMERFPCIMIIVLLTGLKLVSKRKGRTLGIKIRHIYIERIEERK